MKKVIMAFALVLISALCFAGNQQTKASKDSTNSGQVVVMDKNMFINDVFDYRIHPIGNTKVSFRLSLTCMPIGVALAAWLPLL